MLKRLASVAGLLALAATAGCTTPTQVSTAEVEERLARVERERLQTQHAARAGAPADVLANRSPSGSRAGTGDVGTAAWDARRSTDGFALGDVTSDPAAAGTEGAPADGATGEIDRAAIYARRPPLPSFGQTVKRDAKNIGSDLWRDTKRVYGNPVNLAILGVSYGGALAVQESGPDRTVENYYQRSDRTYSRDWADAFGAMGNPGTHFAVAGAMYLVGQQTQNDKTYEVGKTLFSALIINDLSTMVGQAASSDRAPNGEWGTFPSGHTSSTFCMATVLNEAYGPIVGVPMYSLGVLVGVERLNSGEHYLSDVLFGAVMGTVIGHSVATGRDPELFGWKVLPYADPANGSSGIALMKSFK